MRTSAKPAMFPRCDWLFHKSEANVVPEWGWDLAMLVVPEVLVMHWCTVSDGSWAGPKALHSPEGGVFRIRTPRAYFAFHPIFPYVIIPGKFIMWLWKCSSEGPCQKEVYQLCILDSPTFDPTADIYAVGRRPWYWLQFRPTCSRCIFKQYSGLRCTL